MKRTTLTMKKMTTEMMKKKAKKQAFVPSEGVPSTWHLLEA